MIGTYEIKVNGLLMGSKPTMRGALALVTLKYHGKENVTIERRGEVLWNSNEKH